MKPAKFHVVFDRKNLTKKSADQALIYIDCSKNGKRLYINTGIKIQKKHWKGVVNNWVSSADPNSVFSNTHINNIYQNVLKFDESQMLNLIDYPIEALKGLIKAKQYNSFIEFFENEFKDNPNFEANTKKNYQSTLNHLNTFGGLKYFSDINYTGIEAFNRYLVKLKLKDTTIEKYHKAIRKTINEAIKKGYLDKGNKPYDNFIIKSKPTDMICLTDDEINRMESAQIAPQKMGLSRAKDMFMFCIYTGTRYSDLIQVSNKTIRYTDEGIFFEYISVKTKKFKSDNLRNYFKSESVEMSRPELIIDKYKKFLNVEPFKLSLPTYNTHLKKLAALAKINKKITSHTARHSFFTFLADKVSTPVLQELGQHSDISTTMNYIHVKEKMIQKDLEKVNWKIGK